MKENGKNPYAIYTGKAAEGQIIHGTRCVMKGPMMICVSATQRDTNEDSSSAGVLADIVTQLYAKRPSVEDKAISYITDAANRGLYMIHDKDKPFCCDAVMLFMMKDKFRYVISGNSHIYCFADGVLRNTPDNRDYPLIGSRLDYKAYVSEPFEAKQGENAFLLCSDRLTSLVSLPTIQKTLADSASAEEWLNKLVDAAGAEEHFCAAAIILKPKQGRFLSGLLDTWQRG